MAFERIYPLKDYYNRGGAGRAVHKTIVILGTGGTGGWLIPQLARYAALLSRTRRAEGRGTPDQIDLVIVDGDTVEEKNLIRQNFIPRDIGRSKAEVIAERYSVAFGTRIAFFDSFIENPEALNRLVFSQAANAKPIVVTCVDNHKTRRLVWRWFQERAPDGAFWLDSGNEEHNGQTVIARKSIIRAGSFLDHGTTPKVFALPSFFDLFPEAFGELGMLPSEEEAARRADCALMAQESPQTIFTNMTAAQNLMNALQQILLHEPLTYHMSYFDTQRGITRPIKLTEQVLKANDAKIAGLPAKLKELDLEKVAHATG